MSTSDPTVCVAVLTLVRFHEEIVLLEVVDAAHECHWLANEVLDLRDADEWVGLSVDCLDFFRHDYCLRVVNL